MYASRSHRLVGVAALLAITLLPALQVPTAAAGSMFGSYFETLFGYSAGTFGYTWYPIVGDLDLDGRDDLVHLRTDEGTFARLLVRFGEPDGRLSGIPLALPLPGAMAMDYWPCIDDIDGDGIPDIVIGAHTALVICRGLGGRSFAPAVSIPEACDGYVSAADLNGDDIPDYACVERIPGAPDSVRVRFGAGNLAFTPGPAFAMEGPNAFLLDVNHDALLDVLAGNTLLLNAGAGSFTSMVFSGSVAFETGDLDGDGDPDLLTYDGARLGNGDGTFQSPVPYGTTGDPQALVDLDEDGRLDLVGIRIDSVAQGGVTWISVAPGRGDGTFGAEGLHRTCRTSQVISHGDFDQDGHEDLVLLRWDSSSEVYMFGRGTGGFRQAARTFPAGAFGPVDTADFGPDAIPDLVIRSSTAPTIAALLSEGPADYAAPVLYPTLAVPTALAIGDLNADDRQDVVVGYAGTSQLSVWLAQSDGTLGPRTDTPTSSGTNRHVLADLDGNGKLDLISYPGNTWRAGNGDGSFGAPIALPAGINNLFEVVDLDGNGALDVVTNIGNGVRTMLASSPGVFASFTDYSGTSSPLFLGTGYFDPGMVRDVVVMTDSVRVFRGLGAGALGAPVSVGSGPGTVRLVGDVNGDGLTDLMGYGSLAVWVSLGTGDRPTPRFGFGPQFLNASGGGLMTLADVDGNGAPDMVVAEQTNVVTLLLNQTITPNVGVPPAPRIPATLAVRALPNPVRGRVWLRLELVSRAPVEVALFDIAGRSVARARLERPAAAGLSLALEGADGLPTGLYLVRARQGNDVTTARVCVVR